MSFSASSTILEKPLSRRFHQFFNCWKVSFAQIHLVIAIVIAFVIAFVIAIVIAIVIAFVIAFAIQTLDQINFTIWSALAWETLWICAWMLRNTLVYIYIHPCSQPCSWTLFVNRCSWIVECNVHRYTYIHTCTHASIYVCIPSPIQQQRQRQQQRQQQQFFVKQGGKHYKYTWNIWTYMHASEISGGVLHGDRPNMPTWFWPFNYFLDEIYNFFCCALFFLLFSSMLFFANLQT